MTRILSGVLPITLTPFTDDGAVDEASIDTLVEDYLGAGSHGLTVLGIMGEAAKLLDVERDVVLRRYLAATAGRVPVVVGVSARASWMALDYARRAEDAGAAAVMLAAPDGVRNLELVFEHFRRVSESVSIPVVVQDEPVNTGVTMPAPFLVRLLDELEGCRYLKLEETPTLPKITAVKEQARTPVGIFGGLGGAYYYEELVRGADGIMTGFGFPQARAHLRAVRVRRPRPGAGVLLQTPPTDPVRGAARRRGRDDPQGGLRSSRGDRVTARTLPGAAGRCADPFRASASRRLLT